MPERPDLEELRREAEEAIGAAGTAAELEDLRVRYLGRKSALTQVLRSIGELPPEERIALTERAAADSLPLAAMIKDDDRCIRCGLCAIRCPTDAMTMERFQVTERFAGSAS